jgi:hypothetical protein
MRKRNNPYNERESFTCEFCGEKFRLGSSLWIHKHKYHRDEMVVTSE